MTSAKVPMVSTITLEEAKVLAASEGSGVKLVKDLDLVLQIHPMYTNDIRKGVAEELNSRSKRFSKTLGGIVLGYEKVRISPTGGLVHTSPFIHLRVWANFYLFSPEVGMTLEGVVRKKSPHHLSCLVHNIINVSVSRPHNVNAVKWEGANVEEGAKVKITLTSVDMAFHLPMITGQLESVLNSPGTTSKLMKIPSSNKIKTFEEDENPLTATRKVFGDSGISSDGDDEKAVKKKKKKASKHASQTDKQEVKGVSGNIKEKTKKNPLATKTIKQEIESDDNNESDGVSNIEKTKMNMLASKNFSQEIKTDDGTRKDKKKKKMSIDISIVKREPLSPNRSQNETDEALANVVNDCLDELGFSEAKKKKPKKKKTDKALANVVSECLDELGFSEAKEKKPKKKKTDKALANVVNDCLDKLGFSEAKEKKPKKKRKVSVENVMDVAKIKKEPETFSSVVVKRKAEEAAGAQKKKRKTQG